MKLSQLKSLRIGDKLVFRPTCLASDQPEATGEVTEIGCHGLRVKWNDGVCSLFRFDDKEDTRIKLTHLA